MSILLDNPPTVASKFKLATWEDVKQKALRLIKQKKVKDYKELQGGKVISAVVDGDNGEYDVYIFRSDLPKKELTNWGCSCKWDSWARDRQTYYLRVCSHALAVMLIMNNKSYLNVRRNDPYDYTKQQGAQR